MGGGLLGEPPSPASLVEKKGSFRARGDFGAERRARKAGFWDNRDLSISQQQHPRCSSLFQPPRIGAQCPHRYPDAANRENSMVLKENPTRPGKTVPRHPGLSLSFLQSNVSPHPKRNGDPLPQDTDLETEQGRSSPGATP